MVTPHINSSFRATELTPQIRLRIAVASVVLYFVLCFILRSISHFTALPILSLFPVIVISWLYGTRIGVVAGLACFPVNAVVLTVIGINWIDNMVRTGGGLVGSISLVLIGIIVGRLSELGRRLNAELLARQVVEQELRLHRENLENLVNDKVRDLQESQGRFRAISDNSPDAILITDVLGTIRYCNRGSEIMFGYGQDEMLGENSVMFLPAGMREEERNRRDSIARSGIHASISATIESEMVRKNGAVFPVEFSLYSWSLEGNLFYSMMVRDITERRHAESGMLAAAEALQRSHDFFQSVFNVSGDGIYVTDQVGNITFANTSLCEMLGYEHHELIGMFALDLTGNLLNTPFDSEQAQEMFSRDYSAPFETVYERKDGSSLLVENRLTNMPDGETFGSGLISTLRDITERKQAESNMLAAAEALQRSRNFFQSVFDVSGDGIYVTDQMGNITFANSSLCEMLGYEHHELIGIDAVDLTADMLNTPLDSEQEQEMFSRDYHIPFETTYLRKDGSSLLVESRLTIMPDGETSGSGLIATLRDITVRKGAEEEIRQARDFLETLFKTTPDAIIAVDVLGIITAVNDSVYDVYGYRAEELIGQPVSTLPDADEQSKNRHRSLVEQVRKQGLVRNFENVSQHRDGHQIQIETSVALLKNTDGTPAGVISSTRDITERKRAEQEIRQARDFLETTFKTSPDAIIVVDADGYITTANDSVYDVYGYSPAELVGQHISLLSSGDEKSMINNHILIEQVYEHGIVRNYETTRVHKEGHRIQVETSIALMHNPDGDVVGAISSTRDITDRLRLQDQLRQAQKMEAIGTLAGGIAHDFNNILGAIIGYAELSQQDADCVPQIRNNLDQVLNAAERARNLVKQLLAFSRKSQSEVKPLQVHVILKEALKLMRASIPANIEITVNTTDTGDVVLADATQIHQIIVNLCTNAAQAMENSGGVLAIELEPIVLQDADVVTYCDLHPGLYVQLTVRDTGMGIESQNISRIFEPFFTTKDVGKGTGMGLAVVHGIVKSLKGEIKVYSEPGRGTVFNVLLPALQEEVSARAAVMADPPQGHESVLLVDDEPALLQVGASMMRSLGYQVTAVQKPSEALELFASDPNAFDLIFTDQAMPGLTGFELAQQVFGLRPDISIILCTGYSDLVTEEAALAAGIKAFVLKPLSRLKIAEIMRRVMDEAGSD